MIEKLSKNYQKGIFSILKNLKIKKEEKRKIWFIEIDKIFKEKNLKIFYLPFENLEKLIHEKDFIKMPDPKKYLIGLTHYFENEKKIFENIKVKKYYINKNKKKMKKYLDFPKDISNKKTNFSINKKNMYYLSMGKNRKKIINEKKENINKSFKKKFLINFKKEKDIFYKFKKKYFQNQILSNKINENNNVNKLLDIFKKSKTKKKILDS